MQLHVDKFLDCWTLFMLKLLKLTLLTLRKFFNTTKSYSSDESRTISKKYMILIWCCQERIQLQPFTILYYLPWNSLLWYILPQNIPFPLISHELPDHWCQWFVLNILVIILVTLGCLDNVPKNIGDNEFQQSRGAGEGIYRYEDGAENTWWWTRDILHRMPGGWDKLVLNFRINKFGAH